MKKEEIREEQVNCHNCSHKVVCFRYKLVKNKYKHNIITWTELGKAGIKYNCKNFHYNKFDIYQLNDFKELLKRKIDKSQGYPLLGLYDILRLLEKIDEKS